MVLKGQDLPFQKAAMREMELRSPITDPQNSKPVRLHQIFSQTPTTLPLVTPSK
jgi:hypothetical protein